ncbi:MAG: thioredoxin domain-containing protein [Mucilaginibacter sp.]
MEHAHNPVNWYPWGQKALDKAKRENKILIISIGYAACHWCHVMERETYEDTAVARLMNKYFVAIKVDREERPDIDQVYMTASQLITGSGGWPLNVLALPNGKPFYAGTYFPKNDWIKMLNFYIDLNKKSPDEIAKQALAVTNGIRSAETISFKAKDANFTMNDLNEQFKNIESGLDFKKGGFERAPKFPMPVDWEYLLQYHKLSHNDNALRAVRATIDHMAAGGIYDQLSGGFARYSTDADWHVPHFEKMLYDNAQLVSLYTHAWQLTKDPLYKQVVYQTIGFVSRELTSPQGGFYSSLDADSQGEEGKFYEWTSAEIDSILGSDATLFKSYYNITNTGNWEHGKNILFKTETDNVLSKKYNLSVIVLQHKIAVEKEKLFAARTKRIRPGLDDKILTSWNALMLKAYAQAYRAFGEERFLTAALNNANFLEKHAIQPSKEITRDYKNGHSSVNGLLDDYAFTISAFIELYQATFDEKWLIEANKITGYALTHFSDARSGMFFYTNNEYAKLISRKMELEDNVIPASNSEMAINLFELGQYFYRDDYVDKAKQMLENVKDKLAKNVSFYANWGLLEESFVSPPYEVAIVGNQYSAIRAKIDQNYLPGVLLSGGRNEGTLKLLEDKLVKGQTTIYVCQNKSCRRPVTEVAKALEQLK